MPPRSVTPGRRQRDKVVVFMPAYFAAGSLRRVCERIPPGYVDDIIVVDDHSQDGIDTVAASLGLRFFSNASNLGYGGNVKVCFQRALEIGADILIELHPDDQYDPAVIPAALDKLHEGCDLVLGSRFPTAGAALRHAMPVWKYAINRLSTWPARVMLGLPLSDFHNGFRVYRRPMLEHLAWQRNADDYLFSFQIIAQARYAGFRIGEVPVVCRYFPGATQITFRKAMTYGVGALRTLGAYRRSKPGRIDPLFRIATPGSGTGGAHHPPPSARL
jgi:glycosyltransferase involved in cell wall biosynthesis